MKSREPALCVILGILLLSAASKGCFLVGDLNGDCRVDLDDLVLMASVWLEAPYCSEAGLVVHWRLDESSGGVAVDSSGRGRHGNVVGGVGWNPTAGILGGALQFDGVNAYLWSSYQGITGSNPRTCTAWIKIRQSPGEIMSWGNRDVDGGRWVVWVDETGVLRVDTGGGYAMGTTVLTDDRWHHIAVTFDGSSVNDIALYSDGKVETISGIVPQSINTQAWATAKLGVFERQYFTGNHYFDGLIDDARIYDRALGLKEVWNVAAAASTLYDCADLNTDQTVNLSDMAMLSQSWSDQPPLVLINEFLATNQSRSPLGTGGLLDGNGDASDWIELYNNSYRPVDISGWYLTDNAADPTRWQFPADSGELTLGPGDYLIVFASGKTQTEKPDNYPYVDPAGYLHTNFSLSRDGEYLGLFAADGATPIHEYNHFALSGGVYGYPPQEDDITYGYYYGQTRYFSPPTPGTDNVAGAFTGFVEKPYVNIKGGGHVNPVEVTLTCGTPGAIIRYTTDGTAPCVLTGQDYTGPMTIDSSTTLIAKAFKPGLHPSDARIETYIFVEPDLAAFNSNLPIIIIDTGGQQIPNLNHDPALEPFIDCRVVIMDADDAFGRASIIGPDHLNEKGVGQIRYRGQSTYGKGHYALEFRDEHGLDKYVSPLGMPPESDFVLSYDVIDFTLLKMEIAFKWFREMGHYAPRQRYVEVYLNTGAGKIRSDHYFGLMVLREDITRDKNRVNIARLDAAQNQEPRISGGYIIKNDKYDEDDTKLWEYLENLAYAPYYIHLTGAGRPILQYPPPGRVTQAQINWVTDYLKEVSAVLWQDTNSAYYPDSAAVYTDYIDVISWIDHFIVEQICNDADAFWGSYRTHKEREGKIYSGPPWDFDRSFHNSGNSFDRAYDVWRTQGSIFGRWHQQLQTYLEYRIQFADRWFEHRKEVINTSQTLAYIDHRVEIMSEAMARPQQKNYSGVSDWAANVDLLKTWISNRLGWMDDEIAVRFAPKPPIFSPACGDVNFGELLFISTPSEVSGTIYYTLDGTDPRLPGGGVNPNAQVYSDAASTTDLLVAEASVWKYRYDGSDPGIAWRACDFDDHAWGAGPGLLGFGQDGIVTDIGPRVAGRRSAYFRHTFNVSNISAVTALEMTVVHDDGAVVYLNGQEIGRIYMPDGDIHYDTLAATVVHATPVTTVFSGISPDVLVEGENILAVSVHQVTDHSSDIVFDLELKASRAVESSQIMFDKSRLFVRARIKDGDKWSALNQARFTVPMTLVHFWGFTDTLANNTPFVAMDSSYSLVGPGVMEYQSALQGYPFDPEDENWRKASIERRNAPTNLNYRPEGNQGLDYDEDIMRGVQVKQPFFGDGGRNTLIFHVPTSGYEAMVFSFAAMDEGAAERLIVDYAVNVGQPQWQPYGTFELIEDVYQRYEINFLSVAQAANNPDMKIRIRFDAANAQADDGNRVTFNNFAFEGLPIAGYGRELNAGDIAVIAMNAVEAEEFAWVPLVDIPAGTAIHFTDSSYGSEENGIFCDMFRWTEHLGSGGGPLTWRHTDRVIAGTVIALRIDDKGGPVAWNIGTHTGVQPHLSSSGDQLFAYQGKIIENAVDGVGNYTGDYSNANLLYGINWANPGWAASDAGSTDNSYIPYGLDAAAHTAVHIGPENNYYYVGPVVGPRAFLLEQLSQPVNWMGDGGYREGGYLDLLPKYFVLYDQTGSLSLLHYWHFNTRTGDAVTSVPADYTILSGALAAYPGTGAGYMDSTVGSDINARLGHQAGQSLRVRNPSDTRELLLTLPTTGYRAVQLSYAVTRTTNGARNQTIQYRTSNLGNWYPFDKITVSEIDQVFRFDFSGISAADNNPEFAVRILFDGLNASGTAGNNRFDNITLEGLALPGTNPPPQLIQPILFTEAIVGIPTILDLSEVVIDPEGHPLVFIAESDKPFVIEPTVSGNSLILTPQYQGDAVITLFADDGYNPPLETRFRLLAYPAAQELQAGAFQFNSWLPDKPEHTFPDGMLFLQSNVDDPGVTEALDYPYFIPHDDYHDADEVGLPYNAGRRTRLTGLGQGGISFINTGRRRDLGGALVAINTTALQAVNVSWLAGTEEENFRRYAIRLQYRIGIADNFADVLVNGQPVEYAVHTNGHTQRFGPINLPGAIVNRPYVQLLWRYYHADGDSGARAHLRLDDILIEGQ